MKTITTIVLLAAAGSATAHNSCNMALDAGVRITDKSIEFYNEDKPAYSIVDDQYLIVDGQRLALTSAQRAAVARYASRIRTALPEVRHIALDGIDLAIEAMTITFDGLLGDNNQLSVDLMAELNNIKGDVNRYFSSGNPISINHASDGSLDTLGKQFEARIERLVDTSVQNSIGRIMIAVGKEVLLSGGNMKAFEARMNKFGEQIESQMNAKAAGLESRGQKLCGVIQAIDAREEQLKIAVPAIESFNVIRVNLPEEQIAQHEI